ncbi:MAG: hypothetical protein VKJ87_06585 [Synechococcus sp.]|nr:hypothetical protein [Synechococcus sp.]
MLRSLGRRPLLLILLGGLLLRLLLILLLPPGYDEAYYLFYGAHPALSYFDHPAAVGLWAWLGNQLDWGIVGLRLPSLLSYTAASALLALAARRGLGRSSDLWTAGLTVLSPLLMLVGGVLLLPDAPLLLALSLVLWALAQGWPWGRLGLLLGALTLCKYHALPLLVCLALWALSRAETRRRLLGPEGLRALAAWALVSAPLWIWNSQHSWVSFFFQGGRTVKDAGFNLAGPPLFLASQILALFPTIGVLLLLALAAHRRDQHSDYRRLLRWLALPQLVLFVLLAGRMQVLVSWLVPIWWMLLPLAGEKLAEAWRRRERWLRWWLPLSAALPPLLALLAASHVRHGIAAGLVPSERDTSRELMDTGALRRALQQQPALWQALQQSPLIVGERYYEPGFLALALGPKSQARFTTFNGDSRGFAFWQPADGFAGRSGILFHFSLDPSSADSPERAQERRPWLQQLGPLEPLGSVQLKRGQQAGGTASFYRFGPLPGPWPRRYGPAGPQPQP